MAFELYATVFRHLTFYAELSSTTSPSTGRENEQRGVQALLLGLAGVQRASQLSGGTRGLAEHDELVTSTTFLHSPSPQCGWSVAHYARRVPHRPGKRFRRLHIFSKAERQGQSKGSISAAG